MSTSEVGRVLEQAGRAVEKQVARTAIKAAGTIEAELARTAAKDSIVTKVKNGIPATS